VLRELLKNPNIRSARLLEDSPPALAAAPTTSLVLAKTEDGFVESTAPIEDRREMELFMLDGVSGDNEVENDEEQVDSFVDDSAIATEKQHFLLKTVSFNISQNLVQVCTLFVFVLPANSHFFRCYST
jgi:hypothetical protein